MCVYNTIIYTLITDMWCPISPFQPLRWLYWSITAKYQFTGTHFSRTMRTFYSVLFILTKHIFCFYMIHIKLYNVNFSGHKKWNSEAPLEQGVIWYFGTPRGLCLCKWDIPGRRMLTAHRTGSEIVPQRDPNTSFLM